MKSYTIFLLFLLLSTGTNVYAQDTEYDCDILSYLVHTSNKTLKAFFLNPPSDSIIFNDYRNYFSNCNILKSNNKSVCIVHDSLSVFRKDKTIRYYIYKMDVKGKNYIIGLAVPWSGAGGLITVKKKRKGYKLVSVNLGYF